MKNYIKSTLFFIICCSACSTPQKQQDLKLTLELTEQPFKEIFIGASNSPATNCMQLIDYEDKTLLAYQSRGKISFFNMDNGELFHKIQYESKGPNGIEGLRSFYFIDFDTIYTFSGIPWFFFHTDSSGRVVKKFEIDYLKVDGVPACIDDDFYKNNKRVLKVGDKLHIPTYLYDSNLKNDVTQYATGIVLNLLTDSVEFSNVKYPEIDPARYFYSREFGNGQWVYSFNKMNDLYVFTNKNKWDIIPDKSRYIPKIPRLQFFTDMNQSLYHLVSTPGKLSLVYDKWNNYYYLFFYPGIIIDKGTEMSHLYSLLENKKTFSVIILNENFEVIGEKKMSRDTYNPEMYLLSKKGLHFALHINHPDFDPDFLKFATFNVKTINE